MNKLVEEVGLKRAWSKEAADRPPNDLVKIKKTIAKWYICYRGDRYEKSIKRLAREAVQEYAKMIRTWRPDTIPKGITMYSYGLPPATRRLYLALVNKRILMGELE